jgi:hypothetical protein
MTASIPPDKVVKAQRLLAPFVDGRQEHRLLDELLIEQLLGLLNWMSEVLVGGWFHLSQIISARRAAANSVGRSFANSSDFQKSPLRTRRTPSARCMAEHNV